MTKIIVPSELERKCEEFSVKENDLILVMRKVKNKFTHPIFGIFSEVNNDKKNLRIIQPYILKPCEFLGGGLYVPIVEAIQYDYNYGRVRPQLNISPEDRYTYVKISPTLQKLFSGQEEIVKTLRSLKDFEAHADWIEKLKRPYLRE